MDCSTSSSSLEGSSPFTQSSSPTSALGAPLALPSDAIAIVGIGIKLPGNATTIESFWDIMMEAQSTASAFPKERINHGAHYNSQSTMTGTIRPRKGHFLKEDLAAFDASFFGFSAAEASAMDPQQRGLLETTYHALENAGMSMESVYGSNTSVHTGCFTADYMMLMSKDPETMPKYTATGVAATMLSNRISAFYNLHGPSATIDTACSSSLVALDQACQTLQSGQSTMGIVAGCNLIFSLDLTIGLSNMGFLSPDGICHSFDHRANGYARGEGFTVIIIKPILDALRDGDTIRAVIRATGTNQDGNTPLAQPSKESQAALIRATYQRARLDPSDTRYVEAHGTGTPVGDPLEAIAIGTSFAAGQPKDKFVYVSSLKANFGHLEGAAGLAGLIKTVLVLERGIIPPLANLHKVNPEIDVDFLNLRFPEKPTPWPSRGLRRASVNSFGFGGSNAHCIVEDAYHFLQRYGLNGKHITRPSPPTRVELQSVTRETTKKSAVTVIANHETPILLTWSAKDGTSLNAMISDYKAWFSNLGDTLYQKGFWPTLACTLVKRRSSLAWKSFAIKHPLHGPDQLQISTPSEASARSELSLAFIFTGQGAQWIGMGKELLVHEVFRRSVVDAVVYLMSLGCYWHFAGAFTGELEPMTKINEPGFAQPLCTILQVALVDLLVSVNLRPSLVIGHSSGEIAAAYSCGAIDRQSAWKLAYHRGLCSNKLAVDVNCQGAMAAVALPEKDLRKYIDILKDEIGAVDLVIACFNSPESLTVSGNRDHVTKLVAKLDQDGVFTRMLRVPVAYHSPHMEYVSNEYLDAIGMLDTGDMLPRTHVNMVSSVTGERIEKAALRDPSYWVQNMVSPVKFTQALQFAFAEPRKVLSNKLDLSHLSILRATDILEIGPHCALSGPVRDTLRMFADCTEVTYLSTLVRKKDACVSLLETIGRLHCRGYTPNLSQLNAVTKEDGLAQISNLPQYPFNHSKSFWHESRLSKSLRFRTHARNPFLGSPAADWNPSDARWRHFLSPIDSHWIADHKINDRLIFPAAGMINMAMEAALQLASGIKVSAFEITNTTFGAALDLSNVADGIESQLQMIAQDGTTAKYGLVHDWYLRIYQQDVWVEICRGTIRAVPAMEDVNEVDSGNETTQLTDRARCHFSTVSRQCSNDLDGSVLYERLWNCGYHFQESFRRISSSKHSSTGEATASVMILEGQGSEMPRIVHPATLDGILQIMLPGITEGGQTSGFATSLPTRIDKMWVARTGLLRENNEFVEVAVKVRKYGHRNTISDIVAMLPDMEMKVFVQGIETTSITDNVDTSAESDSRPRLAYSIVQKPDVHRVDHTQLEKYLADCVPESVASCNYKRDLDVLLYGFLHDAISIIDAQQFSHSHLSKYYAWMQQQLKSSDLSTASRATGSQDAVHVLQSEISDRYPKLSQIYCRVGAHLADLVNGHVDPLTLLFSGSDMLDFYETLFELSDFMVPLARYLDLLMHSNPSMTVLEVGAGTGAATKHILKSLTMYQTYCFTDISPSFLAQAKSRLAENHNIDYKLFDLEKDPFHQDFELESFDVIVASLVLHATTSIDRTLQNLHKLLKPGGKLIAVEVTAPDHISAGFVFGLLPGWWLSADSYRKGRLSPCLTSDEWHATLVANGFSGTDHVFWDEQEHEQRLNSVFISTKVSIGRTQASSLLSSATIVTGKFFHEPHMVLCESQLRTLGSSVTHRNLDSLSTDGALSNKLVIIYDSTSEPILHNLTATTFTCLQQLLLLASNILWVSTSDRRGSQPATGATYGLARALRSENSALKMTIFEADVSSCSETQAFNLNHVLQQCLDPFAQIWEPEIVESKGMLHTSRTIEDVRLNKLIGEVECETVQRDVRFGDAALRLAVRTPGLLDSLHFEQTTGYSAELSPHEVEVRVMAIGVNFKDCLVALGRVADDTLGTECAGVIERVGPGCRLLPGDRVAVLALDTYRSVYRCNEALVVEIPDHVPFVEAAKLPTNFVTAHHALVELGRISAGQSVLIHAGAGGTGQAAIQIAQHFGAEVFTTVGSAQKKELMMSMYDIPDDHIFYSRDTSFAHGIKRMTGNCGVDLVLNSLAGEELRASWECIAPYGRFLEIGKKDIFSHARLPMYQFAQNVSFSAIDIAAMTQQRPDLIQRSLKAVVDLLAQGVISVARPLKVFSIRQAEEAFRWLQGAAHGGCVALEVNRDTVVSARIFPKRENCFRADATYVVAGGLGGQGKSIIRWMISRGARHIIALSRSGASSLEAMQFANELNVSGIQFEAPPCDIADASTIREVLDTTSAHMPEIRGCIQAAMVIQDSLFHSMTQEQWQLALKPKIDGSWNLHDCLPLDLDFFIMLASTSGIIGSTGQANYAAGNTYQDALAAYRVSRGQRAVSLDLSVMSNEGYFSDHQEALEQYLQMKRLEPMNQTQLFAVIEKYCDPQLKVEEAQSQVVMGLSLPSDVKEDNGNLPGWMDQPLFSHLHQMRPSFTMHGTSTSTTTSSSHATLSLMLSSTKGLVAASELITSALQEKLSRILSRPALDIDVSKPMHAHGVDSLVAVELRNWFSKELHVDILLFEILGTAGVQILAQGVALKLGYRE